MQRARVIREEIQEGNVLFLALHVEMENASLTLLSEGKERLGTLAVSIPQRRGMMGPSISSVLLGDRNVMVARILAERIAQKTRKISLVSVFTETISEREAGTIFIRLLEKIAKRGKEDEST